MGEPMSRPIYARATYATAVAVLGPAAAPFDDMKEHVGWLVMTDQGPVDVYDYGDCHDCEPGCSRDPRLAPDAPVEWHLKAQSSQAAHEVQAALVAAAAAGAETPAA